MGRTSKFVGEPRHAGLLCAAGAVGLGLFYLFMAGAPVRHLAINGAAFLVGLAAYATLTMPRWRLGENAGAIQIGLATTLLATALFAPPVEGAARWIALGPLSLQVSLIILPAMIVGFARRPTAIGGGSMATAALALALQPDRAMAGVLVVSLAVLACLQPKRTVVIPLAIALVGLAVALVQPDALPAIAYVDRIFYTAFSVHPLAGAAVVGGAMLLLLPALASQRGLAAIPIFGAVWASVILAAALGNYPTPLVGFGGSAIVGYLVSLALLPRLRVGRGTELRPVSAPSREHDQDRALAASLA